MRAKDVLLLSWLRCALADGTAREIRDAARITQAEIAMECGVTDQAVALWEAGKRTPRGEPALRYARLLDQLRQRLPAKVSRLAGTLGATESPR